MVDVGEEGKDMEEREGRWMNGRGMEVKGKEVVRCVRDDMWEE